MTETHIDIRLPFSDGGGKWWGKPEAAKWAPVGHKDDNAWNKVKTL